MTTRAIMIEGAKRYARADRSDPFSFNRAMSHIDKGICGTGEAEDGRPFYYDAQRTSERQYLEPGCVFSDGTNEYVIEAYKNVVRP